MWAQHAELVPAERNKRTNESDGGPRFLENETLNLGNELVTAPRHRQEKYLKSIRCWFKEIYILSPVDLIN